MQTPVPENENERLAALRSFDLLDTAPEFALDDITLLASRICGTPIAMISLVDEHRQWFKSRVGTTVSETPRDVAFCAHGIVQPDVFIVSDALTDARFADSPMVTGNPKIRFYAGAPLITEDGHALGMLCVNDQVPRELSPEQMEALRALSRQVVAQFELRRSLMELQKTYARLKKTEESLRLLSSAVQQSREPITITTAELDLPGPAIVFVNPAFTRMTGYTEEEAIGKTPRILQGPRTDRAVLDRLQKELSSGGTFQGETINYRKDGQEFHLEWQVAPLRNETGETTHFVAIQHDITRRKRLEASLLQSRKMETVGKLAGGVAHEFNGILTIIMGQTELLLESLPPGDPGRLNAMEIRKSADRAAALTRQLLAYGRRQFLLPENLDLNSILTGMEGSLRHLAGRHIEVRIVADAGLGAVRADAGQIEHVILNMALNAVEAMPDGGTLTLETGNVSVSGEQESIAPELKAGEYAVISIKDCGSGMTEMVKQRAFEPFFTTKEVGQGTGLGLSSCDGIIRQSGGHISLHSEVNEGTTFKIYLPRVVPPSAGSVPRSGPADLPHGSETVLLVDSDPAMRDLVSSLLQTLGYTVLAAADESEALRLSEQAGESSIALLITDVATLPGSGREPAEKIRRMHPEARVLYTFRSLGNDIPVVDGLHDREGLLGKPFTPAALAGKVRELLDTRVSSCPR